MTGGGPPIAPLSPELRHCTAYPEYRPEATWAQPLGPGRAVLTRGVSRRSGSVACVRADASPTEVLARPFCPATHCSSNIFHGHLDLRHYDCFGNNSDRRGVGHARYPPGAVGAAAVEAYPRKHG